MPLAISYGLEDLQTSWRPVFPVQINYSRTEVNPQFVSIVPHSEIVIVVTFDVDGTFAGVTVGVDDITSDSRETTASYKVAGLTLGVEHAKSGTDHQVQVDVSTVVGATTTIDGTTGGITLSIDRNQNADNDAFEDGSWYDGLSTQDKDLNDIIESMCPEFINIRYHNPFINVCLLFTFLHKYICISSALIKSFFFKK